jgi:hypothetical protein
LTKFHQISSNLVNLLQLLLYNYMKKVKIEKITKKCVVESEYDRKSNVLKFLLEFFISYHSFFFIGIHYEFK